MIGNDFFFFASSCHVMVLSRTHGYEQWYFMLLPPGTLYHWINWCWQDEAFCWTGKSVWRWNCQCWCHAGHQNCCCLQCNRVRTMRIHILNRCIAVLILLPLRLPRRKWTASSIIFSGIYLLMQCVECIWLHISRKCQFPGRHQQRDLWCEAVQRQGHACGE